MPFLSPFLQHLGATGGAIKIVGDFVGKVAYNENKNHGEYNIKVGFANK